MSASLYWYPPRTEGTPLSYELRNALGRKLFNTDGSIGGTINVGPDLVEYLEGVRDGGIEDAQDLIDAIKKHGAVTLVWEH